MGKTQLQKLRNAIEFTGVYRSIGDKYIREAKCLEIQTRNILGGIKDGDLIAGIMDHDFVGFSPQYGGVYTYFINEEPFKQAMAECAAEAGIAFIKDCQAILEFWSHEKTVKKVDNKFIERYGREPWPSYHSPGIGNCGCRVAGTQVDLDKLIRLGLPGIREEIRQAALSGENPCFYEALDITVGTISLACEHYRVQALEMAENAVGTRKTELFAMADRLGRIRREKPGSFAEGLQLMWIYSVISDLMNYGRFDVYLGDPYVQDLDNGVMTEEEGQAYIASLYRHFKTINKMHDCRVTVGGRGRRNPENADRLAIAVMEASRRFRDVVPQLTLRYHNEMDEKVFDKAMQVNGEGCTFPIIYSDDTNVPAVMKVYGVPENEAERYLPFGCGEYVLEGLSTGTPNNGINLLKGLELALHNGLDKWHNVQVGMETGNPEDFGSFDELFTAYGKQLDVVVEMFAYHKMLNYQVASDQAAYLHMSLLMDDCIARGKALLEGGVRYLNASSEIYGIVSAADSFMAIKHLVYDRKVLTLPELVQALDGDFAGREDIRKLCLEAPKYGNDDDEADSMMKKVFGDIAQRTVEAGRKTTLNRYNIVSVNNSMSAEWGYFCEASACGRLKGSALSNGNGASIGADRNGITSLLNSMAKIDPDKHVGVIHNVRFTKEMFAGSADKVKGLLKTFYENNGVQTNITVVGREDLINALAEPDEYRNLLVRIGGFSAKFVDLDPIVQREIIDRTTYGECS